MGGGEGEETWEAAAAATVQQQQTQPLRRSSVSIPEKYHYMSLLHTTSVEKKGETEEVVKVPI